MSEKICTYREQGATELKTSGAVIFPNRPPLKAVSEKKCKVLVEKGMQDVICHNIDMDHFVCPISPQRVKAS